MTRIKLLVYLIGLLSALPAGAQYYTNYPTLDNPSHYLESYHGDIRVREDQTQAAFLLVLLNLLSPIEGIRQDDMVPPGDLKAIGLTERLYGVAELNKDILPRALTAIRDEIDIQQEVYRILPDRLIDMQRSIASKIGEQPNLEDITKLAAISFVHPDPLIRIASAPLLIVLTDGEQEALEELRRGTQLKDQRLSLLATTLLARFKAKDSALEQLTEEQKPGSDPTENPHSTLVIHGTWANDENWWRNGYPFFEYLEHEVQMDDLYIGDKPFAWTGTWSHDARKQAATELATWATKNKKACLNIVAHSHGANIGFIASSGIPFGRMILLSTPAHPHRYSPKPENYQSIFSLRVHLDLVVLADGGGNRFPANWSGVEEKYIGWFNHSSTHYESRWEKNNVPSWLATDKTCQ